MRQKQFGVVVRSERLWSRSRSLPYEPTRGATVDAATEMQRSWPAVRCRDWSGCTERNSQQTNQHLPRPGRAARRYGEWYLAKECVGSNRALTRTIATSRSDDDLAEFQKVTTAPKITGPIQEKAITHSATRTQLPRWKPLGLDKLFQEGRPIAIDDGFPASRPCRRETRRQIAPGLSRHDPAEHKLLLPAAGWGAATRSRGA